MRRLLLLAVLASACDQGASASPSPKTEPLALAVPPPAVPAYEPFVVREDADFLVKASVILDEMFAIFEQANQDCDALATRIEAWGDKNTTRFSVLTAYGKAHPDAEKVLQKKFQPNLERLTQIISPVLSKCMSGPASSRLAKAFENIAQRTQMQRPR